MNVFCRFSFHPLCGLTKYTVLGSAPSPTLMMIMMDIGPGVSQALVSSGHCCRSTEVSSQDCSSHAPGPAVGGTEATQTLAWPNTCVYMPTKPTAAKTRPDPAAGALVVLLDILQVLNLGSLLQSCNSIFPTAVRRYFSSSFLVTELLGRSCGFIPTSACVPPTRICSRGCWSTGVHQAGRIRGGCQGKQATQAGRCWGSDWNMRAHETAVGRSRPPRQSGGGGGDYRGT